MFNFQNLVFLKGFPFHLKDKKGDVGNLTVSYCLLVILDYKNFLS